MSREHGSVREAVTSATGDYVIPNVTADTYTLEVAMSGFKTTKRKGWRSARATGPPLTLEIGGPGETVTVTADRSDSGQPPVRRERQADPGKCHSAYPRVRCRQQLERRPGLADHVTVLALTGAHTRADARHARAKESERCVGYR